MDQTYWLPIVQNYTVNLFHIPELLPFRIYNIYRGKKQAEYKKAKNRIAFPFLFSRCRDEFYWGLCGIRLKVQCVYLCCVLFLVLIKVEKRKVGWGITSFRSSTTSLSSVPNQVGTTVLFISARKLQTDCWLCHYV